MHNYIPIETKKTINYQIRTITSLVRDAESGVPYGRSLSRRHCSDALQKTCNMLADIVESVKCILFMGRSIENRRKQ